MPNKAHKQKHASKHAVAEREQGRKVDVRKANPKARPNFSKDRAKQAALALREKKNKAILEQKRVGSVVGPPKILGFVPMNESANSLLAAQQFERSAVGASENSDFPRTIVGREVKQRFTIVVESESNEQNVVDVAKVADVLVLVLDCSQGVQRAIEEMQEDSQVNDDDDDDKSFATDATWFNNIGLCVTDLTRELVTLLNSQGLPSVVVVLQGLESFANQKKRMKTEKVHRRYFESVFGDFVKVFSMECDEDYTTLVRAVSVLKLRQLKWREMRPYMVVEGGDYNDESTTLTVHGYLRGNQLSANQLIHITDHGTFQIESIALLGDPHPLGRSQAEQSFVEKSDENMRESLVCIQPNETLEDEGLPTDADVLYEQEHATKKIRVPAGVSEYQAAWYEFEDNDEGNDTAEAAAPRGDDFIDVDAMSRRTTHTEVDFLKATDVIRHERMTDEERLEELQRLKDMSEEEMWNPDIVDTPINLPARQRFGKYRGMKSFQTGVWDVNENLPIQYGHIFKLQGYPRVRDAAIEKCEGGGAHNGWYVTVTLQNVPKSVWEAMQTAPLVIASGQLEHEQKWSLLHFHVQRNPELDEPIKSKTAMLAHIGFRKFYVTPLFSDATVGDRTKFARFFHEDEKFRLASFYGPISYNPCPILLFLVPSLEEQNEESSSLRLACFGSAQPPNPDLLILKRTVLTGRVAMIHKKQIVVKYMFFNEDDVKWFQPVDIYTKLGRRGKITKAVGTHGLFKAVLNDQIMQHDVICMDLFKRVFPKWTTVAFNVCEVRASTITESEN